LPGGDEHPPGDSNYFGSILVFMDFELILTGEEDMINGLVGIEG